jgi:hypothetical protein
MKVFHTARTRNRVACSDNGELMQITRILPSPVTGSCTDLIQVGELLLNVQNHIVGLTQDLRFWPHKTEGLLPQLEVRFLERGEEVTFVQN